MKLNVSQWEVPDSLQETPTCIGPQKTNIFRWNCQVGLSPLESTASVLLLHNRNCILVRYFLRKQERQDCQRNKDWRLLFLHLCPVDKIKWWCWVSVCGMKSSLSSAELVLEELASFPPASAPETVTSASQFLRWILCPLFLPVLQFSEQRGGNGDPGLQSGDKTREIRSVALADLSSNCSQVAEQKISSGNSEYVHSDKTGPTWTSFCFVTWNTSCGQEKPLTPKWGRSTLTTGNPHSKFPLFWARFLDSFFFFFAKNCMISANVGSRDLCPALWWKHVDT